MKKTTLVTLSGALLCASLCPAELFKDCDRVVFLGDSITHQGYYMCDIYDYYLTRFPERTVRFINAGVGGDSASGCKGRFTEDVTVKHPTQVCVMFGMNDIHRECYVRNPTEQHLQGRRDALAAYARNMAALVKRISDEIPAARMTLMTPSPHDDRVVFPDAPEEDPFFGCRDALGSCADVVRRLSASNGTALVDFYTPMTDYSRRRQKRDPAYTLIGRDRTHPGEAGALFMAWRFLVAQGADALVSDITVDATRKTCDKALNAEVRMTSDASSTCLSFDVLERALPFPVIPKARAFAAEIPIERDLNQEILTITGLPEGRYTLAIDGTPVATQTAREWSDGVNLAQNEKTPQYRQAMTVHALNRRRFWTESKIRFWASERWFLASRVKDVDDMTEVGAFADRLKAAGQKGYFEDGMSEYVREWPTRQEVLTRLESETQDVLAARQPRIHHYAVTKED